MTERYEESPMKKLAAFFYEDEIERLNGEIERLRAALRFYAEPGCYTFIPMVKADGSFFISSIVVRDGGEKARAALEEKE